MAKVQKNKLTFIKQTKWGKHHKAIYKCECGKEKELYIFNVTSGSTKSCGCSTNKTHGLSKLKIYDIWCGIKGRCTNTENEDYHNYGGRGVRICEEWLSNPESFCKWAISNGWKRGMEIDKDKKEGMVYSPENCVVLTKKQNANHRRDNHVIQYKGYSKTIQEWAEMIGIDPKNLRYRLSISGWDLEKSVFRKMRPDKRRHSAELKINFFEKLKSNGIT